LHSRRGRKKKEREGSKAINKPCGLEKREGKNFHYEAMKIAEKKGGRSWPIAAVRLKKRGRGTGAFSLSS